MELALDRRIPECLVSPSALRLQTAISPVRLYPRKALALASSAGIFNQQRIASCFQLKKAMMEASGTIGYPLASFTIITADEHRRARFNEFEQAPVLPIQELKAYAALQS